MNENQGQGILILVIKKTNFKLKKPLPHQSKLTSRLSIHPQKLLIKNYLSTKPNTKIAKNAI